MKRGLKLTLIFIGDILFSGICLIVFALFHHVIQRNFESEDVKIESTANISTCENSKNEDSGIYACTCKTEAVSNDDKYVSENVAINLDAYKSKVDAFRLRIEGIDFVEVGRNNSGVIFKIIPSKLPQEETEGEYYIIDGNNELVTSGNYYYI